VAPAALALIRRAAEDLRWRLKVAMLVGLNLCSPAAVPGSARSASNSGRLLAATGPLPAAPASQRRWELDMATALQVQDIRFHRKWTKQ